MNNTLGDLMKTKRKELKLSLRGAANLIGISHSYLSMLEKGLDPRNSTPIKPTPETLKLISKAYDTDYNLLMELVGYISLNNTNSIEEAKYEINIPKEYTDKHKVTSRDKKQYLEEMKKANEAFFMNDELNEEAKREMLDLMSELFWEAKSMNKRKK